MNHRTSGSYALILYGKGLLGRPPKPSGTVQSAGALLKRDVLFPR